MSWVHEVIIATSPNWGSQLYQEMAVSHHVDKGHPHRWQQCNWHDRRWDRQRMVSHDSIQYGGPGPSENYFFWPKHLRVAAKQARSLQIWAKWH